MRLSSLTVAIAATLAPVGAHAAPNGTPSGYITWMAGGWTNANLRVLTDFAVTNPENCESPDGYMTDPNDPGSALFNSMLLSAYMSHRKVTLTIDGCVVGRPHIISVIVLPN